MAKDRGHDWEIDLDCFFPQYSGINLVSQQIDLDSGLFGLWYQIDAGMVKKLVIVNQKDQNSPQVNNLFSKTLQILAKTKNNNYSPLITF